MPPLGGVRNVGSLPALLQHAFSAADHWLPRQQPDSVGRRGLQSLTLPHRTSNGRTVPVWSGSRHWLDLCKRPLGVATCPTVEAAILTGLDDHQSPSSLLVAGVLAAALRW